MRTKRKMRKASVALLALGGWLTACGAGDATSSGEGPAWIRLATLPGERALLDAGDFVLRGERFARLGDDEGEWLVWPVESLRRASDRRFTAHLELRAPPVLGGTTAPIRLRADGRLLEYVRPNPAEIDASTPGTFTLFGSSLFVDFGGPVAPESVQLEYLVAPSTAPAHAASLDSLRGRQVGGHRYSGRGFRVPPGSSYTLRVDVPPHGALRFATSVETALIERDGLPSDAPRARFRVLLDGEELLDAETDSYAWHTVELPEEGRRGAELSFVVEGDFAATAILAPVIGPAAIGAYGARPWSGARRDVVVFLADTFRADNLTMHGSTLGTTPVLDAFAAANLAFANARSTSTHTLPAHSSLFSGKYPLQLGIDQTSRSLTDEVETLAERLANAGYRTGAITDSAVVSARFGLAQGFEFFDEHQQTLDDTLARARAFLAADDGRPTFLFVQTYRVHTPFHVSDETRARHGDALGIDGTFEEWEVQLQEVMAGTFPRLRNERARLVLDGLRALYRGGVADLDAGFGTFLADLDACGIADDGYLVFTSDHGEAFGEHDDVYHTGPVHDEQVRVPLIVRGPGIEARVETVPASLVDVTPTVLAMAGLPADPELEGTSLLALSNDRALYFQQPGRDPSAKTVGMLLGRRKIICLVTQIEERELGRAFDLERDPLELVDQAAAGAEWPREMFDALVDEALEKMRGEYATDDAVVGHEQAEQLRALGY